MATTADIKTALANGRAAKFIIFADEAWYGDANNPARERHIKYQWNVGVTALKADGTEDGSYGSFTLNWCDFHRDRHLSLQLDAFADSFAAMAACDGFLDTLMTFTDRTTPDEARAALTAIGFEDRTPRTSPYATT